MKKIDKVQTQINEDIREIKSNEILIDKIEKAIELLTEINHEDSSDEEKMILKSIDKTFKELEEFQQIKFIRNQFLFKQVKQNLYYESKIR